MKLEQWFEVAAPLERVWSALVDVEHVAPCLPGAAVTGRNEDGSYRGTFTIKIGPATASYSGRLAMEEIDQEAHRARMRANGTDRRGHGGAKATIVSELTQLAEDRTRVEVDTEYHITGRLARFGRGGMIEDISEKLLREFAERLHESLAGEGKAAEAPGPEPPEVVAPAAAPGPPARPEPPVPSEGAPSPEPPPAPRPTTRIPPRPTPSLPPRSEPSTGPEALHAEAVVASVVRDRLRANPAPAAFLAGLLLAFLIMRRSRR